MSINNKQFQRWCKFKNEVNCTCDSDALRILLDQWYSAALDKEEEFGTKENGEEMDSTDSRATECNSDNQPKQGLTDDGLSERGSLCVEEEQPQTMCLSTTEGSLTQNTIIPLKMEVDDDAYNEGHEDTIERVLTPSVLVTAEDLKTERENTWTQKFCLISDCKQIRPPSGSDIEKLNAVGLGEKRLTFELDENPATFRETLLLWYPSLREAKGFALFRKKNRSYLEIVSEPSGGFTTSYLSGRNELTGIVCYVRPTVRNITVEGIQCCVKRVRNDLSYAQKLKVIEMLEQGKKQTEVSRIIGCSQAQVSQTFRNKNQIRLQVNENPRRMRLRPGKAADVEQALVDWYQGVYTPGKYIPNEILLEQAEELAAKIGNNAFKPTNGWLSRWKIRCNIPLLTKRGNKKTGTELKATNEEDVSVISEDRDEDHETTSISQSQCSMSQRHVSQSRDGSAFQQAELMSQHSETSLASEELSSQHAGPTEEESFVLEAEKGTEKQAESLRGNVKTTRQLILRGSSASEQGRMVKDSRFSRPLRRKDLSLKEQMCVIDLLDQKLAQREIASQIGCSQPLISSIAARKDKIRAQFLSAENHDRKHDRSGKAPHVESALWAWHQSIQDQEPGKKMVLSDEEIEIDAVKCKPPNRRSYTSKFKMEVLTYAEIKGNRAAERKFNVCESAVRNWRKQKEALRNCKQTVRKMTPQRSTWPDLEAITKSWMVEQRDWGNVLSVEILRKQARKFAEMLKIEGFQGSKQWVRRFLSRNKISLKRIDEENKKETNDNSGN